MKHLLRLVILLSVAFFACEALPQNIDGIGDNDKTQRSFQDYEEPVLNDVKLRVRRECIARHSSCDRNPTGCCSDDTCRCNLWGANCKCAPKGLFG